MARRNPLPVVWKGSSGTRPYREMNRLQRKMDQLLEEFFTEPLGNLFGGETFEAATTEFTPACEIEESDSHYLVNFDLPGVKKDEIKIEVRDNLLIVSGERKREQKEEKQEGRISTERYYGSFSRTFTLPANIDSSQVQARYEDGVLQIDIPKTAASLGREIPIEEGKHLGGKQHERKQLEGKPGKEGKAA